MTIQLHNDAEHQLHFDAIHALSKRYQVDESEIRKLYESKLEELSFNATIKSFLPVLIERHVKNQLLYAHDAYV